MIARELPELDKSVQELSLAPIEKLDTTEIVIERLVSLISSKSVRPGDRLPPERELARRLSVSRNTLREALKILETLGVLRIKQGSGIYVSEGSTEAFSPIFKSVLMLSGPNILDLVEVRKAIEITAAEGAAMRGEDDDFAKIEYFLKKMQADVGKIEQFNEDSLNFHLAVVEASKNPLMWSIYQTIRKMISELQTKGAILPGAMERSLQYHTDIFKAIKSRNTKLAKKRMAEHMDDILIAFIREIEKSSSAE